MTLPALHFQPWGETLQEQLDAAHRAEAAGAAVVWAPELHRSAPVTAAALAARTGTIGVGTGIALAFARSPFLTALSALDLDELSGGRLRLGLGTGVQRLNEDWHGVTWSRPVRRLRETVLAIRLLIAGAHTGEPIDFQGEEVRLRVRGYRRPYAPVRAAIPVYLAGVGPAMTALAGEIGDGWISHELCSPSYLASHVLPRLGAKAGFEVVVSACCAIDDDADAAGPPPPGSSGSTPPCAPTPTCSPSTTSPTSSSGSSRRSGAACPPTGSPARSPPRWSTGSPSPGRRTRSPRGSASTAGSPVRSSSARPRTGCRLRGSARSSSRSCD
ncbi:LLM class flavin-dependent oxidoreductase [Dactylosporangium cerinum]